MFLLFYPFLVRIIFAVYLWVQTEDLSHTLQPFSSDPAKQARYEQFLKDKYEGGLRNVQAAGRNGWTESERAQETIEFEAACQNFQRRETTPVTGNSNSGIASRNLQSIMNDRFVPQTFQKVNNAIGSFRYFCIKWVFLCKL